MTIGITMLFIALLKPTGMLSDEPHCDLLMKQYQWSHLAPQKLTSQGKQILHWISDAQTCLFSQQRDDLEAHERVLLSDLLRCADEKNTQDIASACCEFARTHAIPCSILDILEPLVVAAEPSLDTGANRRQFGPWRIQEGKLRLPVEWLTSHFIASTGAPYHYKLLERPLPKIQRANIEPFKGQIVDEFSRWHPKDLDIKT